MIREDWEDYFWDLMNDLRKKSYWIMNIDDKKRWSADGQRRVRTISFDILEGCKHDLQCL